MGRKKFNPEDDSSPAKILEAAEQIFADKGFYGARVGEIGKAAGVNPALLYYYFNSKEEILHRILSQAIEETSALLEHLFKEIKNPESINETLLDNILDQIINFFQAKSRILKIMLVEMMQADQKNDFFMEFLTPLFDKVEQKQQEMAVYKQDHASFRAHMFFNLAAPLLFYITMGEKWAEFSGSDLSTMREKMKKVMRQMMLTEIYVLK